MSPRTWSHDGVTAHVSDRRRYGSTTYTWVTFSDGVHESTPDPWPAVTPKASEVRAECSRLATVWGSGREAWEEPADEDGDRSPAGGSINFRFTIPAKGPR